MALLRSVGAEGDEVGFGAAVGPGVAADDLGRGVRPGLAEAKAESGSVNMPPVESTSSSEPSNSGSTGTTIAISVVSGNVPDDTSTAGRVSVDEAVTVAVRARC